LIHEILSLLKHPAYLPGLGCRLRALTAENYNKKVTQGLGCAAKGSLKLDRTSASSIIFGSLELCPGLTTSADCQGWSGVFVPLSDWSTQACQPSIRIRQKHDLRFGELHPRERKVKKNISE